MRRSFGFVFTVFTLVLLFTAAPVSAAGLESPEAVMELTERIMEKVSVGDIGGAVLTMKPHFPIPETEFELLLEQSKQQGPLIAERFGEPAGRELMERRFAGASLMRIVYLQKYSRHAMVWSFIFYRAGDSWQINWFNFDDNIKSLF